jgi:hypothetical protein
MSSSISQECIIEVFKCWNSNSSYNFQVLALALHIVISSLSRSNFFPWKLSFLLCTWNCFYHQKTFNSNYFFDNWIFFSNFLLMHSQRPSVFSFLHLWSFSLHFFFLIPKKITLLCTLLELVILMDHISILLLNVRKVLGLMIAHVGIRSRLAFA